MEKLVQDKERKKCSNCNSNLIDDDLFKGLKLCPNCDDYNKEV